MDHRRALKYAAITMALLEAVMVLATESWAAAVVMALFFGICAWRLGATETGRGAAVAVAVGFLIELLPLPFFARAGMTDWVIQVFTGVLAVTGVVLAVLVLRPRSERLTV
jgi:hypothetical protein